MTDREQFDRNVRVVLANGVYTGRYVAYVDQDGVTQYRLSPEQAAIMDAERAQAAEVRRLLSSDDE